jgi:hypothetical protein
MRRFKLINAAGAEWDLMDTASFFQNPDGLGHSRDIDCVQSGYDFIELQDEPVQKKPGGEIVFGGYAEYRDFVAFCSVSPLILAYKPLTTWNYLKCKIEKLRKKEIDQKTRRLICDVDFIGFCTWYAAKKTYQAAPATGEGKKYPYAYPYGYVDIAAGSVEVNNAGAIASPCILHVFGECVNPSWALIRNGVTVLTGKVNATIPSGHKLVVNASASELEIAEYTTAGAYVKNLYQNSDFSTARFVTIQPGISTITFAHEGAGVLIPPSVEVMQLADSV